MIYGFNTNDKEHATAAFLVYLVYKSRDYKRFKVSTKMWEQITAFAKLSAKKSITIPEFLERFRKPMCCDSLNPRFTKVEEFSSNAAKLLSDGSLFVSAQEQKNSLQEIISQVKDKKILDLLYKQTSFVIYSVRERLEIEKLTDKLEIE